MDRRNFLAMLGGGALGYAYRDSRAAGERPLDAPNRSSAVPHAPIPDQGAVSVLHPDFGPSLDGDGNVTNGHQILAEAVSAVTSSVSYRGRKVHLPHPRALDRDIPGEARYLFPAGVDFPRGRGTVIFGDSVHGTLLEYTGSTPDGAWFDFGNCREWVLADIGMVCSPSGYVDGDGNPVQYSNPSIHFPVRRIRDVFRFENRGLGGGELVPTGMKFYRIMVEGTNGGFEHGARWTADHYGIDQNNDLSYWEACEFANQTGSGWRMEHSQSHDHQMVRSGCRGGNYGRFGVECIHGSFKFQGGGSQFQKIADFYVAAPGPNIVLDGINCEGSPTTILSGLASAAGRNLSITNSRLALNGMRQATQTVDLVRHDGSGLAAFRKTLEAGVVFEWVQRGSVSIEHSSFGEGMGAGGNTNELRFVMNPTGPVALMVDGVIFNTLDGVVRNPFEMTPHAHKVRMHGLKWGHQGAEIGSDTLTPNSVTPSVAYIDHGGVALTANTVNTLLQDFTGGYHGREFVLHVRDDFTQLAANPGDPIVMKSGPFFNALANGTRIRFRRGIDRKWWEV